MAEQIETDLCVLGAGSAGLSIAAAAAALGVRVVLIEKARMGGECLNTGCVPSKALIAAARAAQTIRAATRFGVKARGPEVDFAAVRAHVQSVVADISALDSRERFTALNVRVIQAEGRFVDKSTVGAGGVLIRARRFIIATGSSPIIPPVPGLDAVTYLTNDSIFDLSDLPTRLLVIGAGATGLELAQAFSRLGSDVTVIDAGLALAGIEPEIAEAALARMAREGIVIHERTQVARAEKSGVGVRLVLAGATDETLDGSHLLVAAGRRARIEGLNLDAGAIAWTRDGLTLSSQLRSTTNRRVYAAGDVSGGPKLTSMAGYQAGLVIRQTLFRLRIKQQPQLVPRAIYTDPEIAAVGMSEEDARRHHRAVIVLRWPYSENDRARAERDTGGHIKIVAAKGGRILGAAIVGRQAGELISFWTLAISKGMKIQELRDVIMPYPTLSEISRRASIAFYLPKLSSPRLRQLIKFLQSLG